MPRAPLTMVGEFFGRMVRVIARALLRNAPLKGFAWWLAKKLAVSSRVHCRVRCPEALPMVRAALEVGGESLASSTLHEYQLLRRLSLDRHNIDMVVDVGAHVGQFSLAACQYFPRAAVVAFEPSQPAYAQLRRIRERYPALRCEPAGVGDRTGSAALNLSMSSDVSQASSFLPFSETYKRAYPWARAPTVRREVQMWALDDYFARADPHPGEAILVHADCEGYERFVLAGARGLFDRVQVLILEHTFGLFVGQGTFDDIYDLLRDRFEFRGGLSPLVTGISGRSLYQDLLFVRRGVPGRASRG